MRTFLSRLKEKEHDSDPIFVRRILFPLKESAVYEVRSINPVKPPLEVKKILQRVGLTNPRDVVAHGHLILAQSNDTLVRLMTG